ncbi:helix-turn-helix transcriptional regulator [Brenneria populi]|uniref:Helix-turn-helix transcriptional regulator n=1 Tax=Brenneria populi TaxID=1505588 RepID=A0ABU6JJZ4_9GAMM|nr:helix-turn-helix transcriptional regulator [Brenneria populi Li et al. 2015]
MPEQRIYHPPHTPETVPPFGVFFHNEQVSADTEYLPHSHSWGHLIYVTSGVMVLNIQGKRFWAPPEFAIWVPLGMTHSCYNRRQAAFNTINLTDRLCKELPDFPCLLEVGPIFKAIVDDFLARNMLVPQGKTALRLCRVMLDQMRAAPRRCNYLPETDDKLLAPILRQLEQCPGDNRTLAQWAQQVYSTERTLSRRCQSELGMSFSEWRQRLRFLRALALLRQGMTVQAVALDVGYNSSSALIAMFQKIAGCTPERYRNQ